MSLEQKRRRWRAKDPAKKEALALAKAAGAATIQHHAAVCPNTKCRSRDWKLEAGRQVCCACGRPWR
jgi:hypothetical protein